MKERKECKFYIDQETLPPHGSFIKWDCRLNMMYGTQCIDGHRFKQNEELSIMRKSW